MKREGREREKNTNRHKLKKQKKRVRSVWPKVDQNIALANFTKG